MAYIVIPIPGGGTTLDDRPVVQVVSERNQMVKLIIKYKSCHSDEGPRFGELTFTPVFQYRWTYDEVDYNEFESDAEDYEFGGLIEIIDSAYLADILAKTEKYHGQQGFIAYKKFYNIRHFRLGFDEYGVFDIVAADVLVREIDLSA